VVVGADGSFLDLSVRADNVALSLYAADGSFVRQLTAANEVRLFFARLPAHVLTSIVA
jgi:hypothetical protein